MEHTAEEHTAEEHSTGGHLTGLSEYLDEFYKKSIFDQAMASKSPWQYHLYEEGVVTAGILGNTTYDLKLAINGQAGKTLPKTSVKMLYAADTADAVFKLIKSDKKVKALNLEPIISTKERHYVKNKSFFVLMKEKTVMFLTLLGGEVIRGIIDGFSRYDITVNLKGGLPVTVLRHSIYDLRDKKGRCFLKSFQEQHRDWQKSELFVR